MVEICFMSVRIKNCSVSDNWMKERNLPCLLQRISFYHVIFNTYRYIHTNFSFLQLWAIPDSMNTITYLAFNLQKIMTCLTLLKYFR